jgi:hypothetical protein
MTPKEKAEELFDKYCYAIRMEETDSGYFSNVIYAKQCALISVQEIINSNPHSNPFNTVGSSTMEFWQKVKEEIEKL